MMRPTRQWIIISESTINTVYTVTLDRTGSFSCDCPDFGFRGGDCKHLKKVKVKLAGENQKNKLPLIKGNEKHE
jgi:hypothetical protein